MFAREQECTVEKLAASADLFELLAHFLVLPTSELATALVAGSLRADLEEILSELGVPEDKVTDVLPLLSRYEAGGSDEAQVLKELRIDYAQLFTHPTQPTVGIYESMVLYDPKSNTSKPLLFTNRAALSCEDFYARAGLQRSSQVNEPGDHLATQMQFVQFLFGRAYAEQQSDKDPSQTLQLLDEFTQLHINQWREAFFARVYTCAKTEAYKAFALVGQCDNSNL